MIRLSIPKAAAVGDQVRLSGDDAHYLKTVMRVRPGDSFELLTPEGRLFRAEMGEADLAAVVEELAPPIPVPIHITLYQALLKGDRMRDVVEKGTEVGISRFVPLVTARTVVREASSAKQQRWQTVAKEAAEQCRRREVPTVEPVRDWHRLDPNIGGSWWVLSPQGASWLSLRSEIRDRTLHVVVGPEGGLTDDEVSQLVHQGAKAVSLGPRIYRAENAGVWAALLVLSCS